MKKAPNKKIPEINEPSIKYFKPASVEKDEVRLKHAKIQNDKACNSITKYADIKSKVFTSNNIPRSDKKYSEKYS